MVAILKQFSSLPNFKMEKTKVFIPKGSKIEIIGWIADDLTDPENTLSFILQDTGKEYDAFYWSAFCWPYKVRNSKVNTWLRTGRLPNHMELFSVNDVLYHLKIDGSLCKVKGPIPAPPAHARGFVYYPHNNPSELRTFMLETNNTEEDLKMLFDSYVGSKKSDVHFRVEIEWAVKKSKVTEKPTAADIARAEFLVGYNKQDKILVSVPTNAFKPE